MALSGHRTSTPGGTMPGHWPGYGCNCQIFLVHIRFRALSWRTNARLKHVRPTGFVALTQTCSEMVVILASYKEFLTRYFVYRSLTTGRNSGCHLVLPLTSTSALTSQRWKSGSRQALVSESYPPKHKSNIL